MESHTLSLSQKTVQLFVLGQLDKKLGGRVLVQLFYTCMIVEANWLFEGYRCYLGRVVGHE